MRCPSCNAPLEGLTEYGDHACAACGLAGPRDVLEALAARLADNTALEAAHAAQKQDMFEAGRQFERVQQALKSPAVVLAEAERLLRERQVFEVHLVDVVSVRAPVRFETCLHSRLHDASGATLAEAFAKLKGGEHG